ncbi:V2 [Scenedesmus sp. PABB004]|nr:V2 [Scenedesmus sp. PABB004]
MLASGGRLARVAVARRGLDGLLSSHAAPARRACGARCAATASSGPGQQQALPQEQQQQQQQQQQQPQQPQQQQQQQQQAPPDAGVAETLKLLEVELGPLSQQPMVPAPAPRVVVISGPSGVGKDAVLKRLQERRPELHTVVTATSRCAARRPPRRPRGRAAHLRPPPTPLRGRADARRAAPRSAMRPGEVEGVDYFFVSRPAFEAWIAAEALLEHAVVYGDYKGIPRSQVDDALRRGVDVVLRIDVQGAATVRRLLPGVVSVFIVAESEAALVRRLVSRKTEPLDTMRTRVATARQETRCISEFDYVVVNREGRLEECVAQLCAILDAEKARVRPSSFSPRPWPLHMSWRPSATLLATAALLLVAARAAAAGSGAAAGEALRAAAAGSGGAAGEALRVIVIASPAENSPVLDLMAVAAHLAARGHDITVVTESESFARLAAARHTSNTTAEALRMLHVAAPGVDDVVASVSGAALKSLGKRSVAGLKLLFTLQKAFVAPCEMLLRNATLMTARERLPPRSAPARRRARRRAPRAAARPAPPRAPRRRASRAAATPRQRARAAAARQMTSGTSPEDVRTLRGLARNLPPYLMLNWVLPALGELGGLDRWAPLRAQLGLPRVASVLPPVNALAAALGRPRARCAPVVQVLLTSLELEGPRPLAANQVVVGPGTPRAAHPLSPPAVAEFVGGAPAGVVLVAVGTTPQAKLVLSPRDMLELAEAFALLAPTRVLWPFKPTKALPDGLSLAEFTARLGPNTMLVEWADYNDVLGHANVVAAVSHGGWHSVLEAAFHGVPLLGMPFQFEQTENLLKLVRRGAAVMLPNAPTLRGGRNVSFDHAAVAATIREVVGQPSYAAAAAGLSRALRTYSARRSPYDRTADEIERALLSHAAVRLPEAPAAGAARDEL